MLLLLYALPSSITRDSSNLPLQLQRSSKSVASSARWDSIQHDAPATLWSKAKQDAWCPALQRCLYQWTRTCWMTASTCASIHLNTICWKTEEACSTCTWVLQNITCTFSFGFPFQLWLTSALSAHKMYAHATQAAARLSTLKFWLYRWQNIQHHSRSPAGFFCCFFFPPDHHPINKDHISLHLHLYSSKRHELESFGQVLH